MQGGKALQAGSYGCVFKPPLKCKNKTRQQSGVTKLLFKEHAEKEMEESEFIYELMKRYPKMKHSVLVPYEDNPCEPDKLTTSDLEHFDKTCNNFLKRNIHSSNVNLIRDKLGALQLDYGGEELFQYINQYPWRKHHLEVIHHGLKNITEYVIFPMNDNGLFHADIKNNNIMIKNEQL